MRERYLYFGVLLMVFGLLVPTPGVAVGGGSESAGTMVGSASSDSLATQAKETKRKRNEAEAERKRLAKEAKRKRLEAKEAKKLGSKEAQRKREEAKEAEKQRQLAKEEARKTRLAAKEAKRKRLEAKEEAKRKRLAAREEAKRKRLAAREEARKKRLEAEKRRLAKEEALAEAKRQAACAPGVGFVDGSTCSFSRAQYDVQVERTAKQFRSVGYENQWGLATIRADIGYANLRLLKGKDAKPGAGAKVGVLDTEIALKHPAFVRQGIEVQEVSLSSGSGGNAPESLPIGRVSHGTAVASIIIASPGVWDIELRNFQGIAWGADLKMFSVGRLPSSGSSTFQPLPPHRFYDDSKEAREYREILPQVDFLNISLGNEGIIDDYTEKNIAGLFGKRIEAWTQADRAEKTILVWSAGNSHGEKCVLPTLPVRCEKNPSETDPELSKLVGRVRADSADIESGIPLYFPKLRGHIIATIAVDEAGEVASFSNRCGSAADWCIAAPGVGVRIVYYSTKKGSSGAKLPSYDVGVASGTSTAAPMVTGSLAVMKGLFGDQLSNTDLVVRLFATANKTGRYADEKIYGQGLLDLGAATSPVGEPVIVVVGSVVGGGVPLAMTSLASGKAFGDSLLRSVAGEGVVTFDALGAPFSYDLGSFVGYAKSSSLQERLQTLMDSEDVLEEFETPAYGLSAPVMTTGRRFFPGGRVSRTRNGREASGDVCRPECLLGAWPTKDICPWPKVR